MNENNIIFLTDSYKLNHWNQYPIGTEYVYSYFESRSGARWNNTVLFGLQGILKKNLLGPVVNQIGIEQAAKLAKAHFGNESYFNRAGWEHILNKHDGYLPVRIRAIPEGKTVGVSNVLMTVVNTDPACYWLTNALESLLTHVWFPSTVATLSYETKRVIKFFLEMTTDNSAGLNFMLHDFGFRGTSSTESAEIGGAAHLVNFLGTDTVPAIQYIWDYYHGASDYSNIAYSVAATEHSIQTSLGEDGEPKIIDQLLINYPVGILSVVADSYDIYRFVEKYVGETFKDRILARDGVFVIRPDSITPDHPTPESEMVWIMESLWAKIGGTVNSKGFKVINPKVKVLWGDGIDLEGITKILRNVVAAKFSVENIACFGMGGGLLQKVNRDTQRFAFKSSAQCRDGVWHDVFKSPKDQSKASKRGRLKLVKINGGYKTVNENDEGEDELVTVFENGTLLKDYTFDEIRRNAQL
jgi:nicotinamide phosphoribosyltransferase